MSERHIMIFAENCVEYLLFLLFLQRKKLINYLKGIRMKKKVIALSGIILIIVIVIASIWMIPLLRAAHILSKADDFTRFNFNIEIKIDENSLSDEQLRFADTISWLLGVDLESILNLRAEGSLYESSACAVIYSNGLDMPVTKIYICDDEALINVKMLYEVIENRLIENYPLLKVLLPDWKYGEYITSEQLEGVFGVDLKNLFAIKANENMKEASLFEYMVMLSGLDSKRNNDGIMQFETKCKDYQVIFEINESNGVPFVSFEGLSNSKINKIESFSGEVIFNLNEVIDVPDSIISQQTVDGFDKIWSLLTEILDKYH